MVYVPRTTIPSNDDLRFRMIEYGGWNICRSGSPSLYTGSVLANCVGYAWGRALELLGLTTDYSKLKLSSGTAKYWWTYDDGYPRGQVAKVGSVACWWSEGSGHCAIVEQVHDNGDFTCSNSDFNGQGTLVYPYPYYYNWRYKKSENFINGLGSDYYLQGFIYLPIPEPDIKKKRKFPWVLYANRLRSDK